MLTCGLCSRGFPLAGGVHWGNQSLGMIPGTICELARFRLLNAGAKLHLGCGAHRLPRPWVNVDGLPSPAADFVLRFDEFLKQVPDGAFTSVYWSHGPEHVAPDLLPGVLHELRRILAPGGELLLAAPDLVGIYENRFLTQKNGSAWQAAMFGETNSTDHPYLAHRQVFTHETLTALVRGAGFRRGTRAVQTVLEELEPWDWRLEDYPEIFVLNDYARSCALVTTLVRGVK